jgi:hypothetical protein
MYRAVKYAVAADARAQTRIGGDGEVFVFWAILGAAPGYLTWMLVDGVSGTDIIGWVNQSVSLGAFLVLLGPFGLLVGAKEVFQAILALGILWVPTALVWGAWSRFESKPSEPASLGALASNVAPIQPKPDQSSEQVQQVSATSPIAARDSLRITPRSDGSVEVRWYEDSDACFVECFESEDKARPRVAELLAAMARRGEATRRTAELGRRAQRAPWV